MLEVNFKNFENEVTKWPEPVLVCFHAPWCLPCKSYLPILDSLSKHRLIKMVHLDVSKSANIPAIFGIQSVPNTLIIKGNMVLKQLSGVPSVAKILAAIESVKNTQK